MKKDEGYGKVILLYLFITIFGIFWTVGLSTPNDSNERVYNETDKKVVINYWYGW